MTNTQGLTSPNTQPSELERKLYAGEQISADERSHLAHLLQSLRISHDIRTRKGDNDAYMAGVLDGILDSYERMFGKPTAKPTAPTDIVTADASSDAAPMVAPSSREATDEQVAQLAAKLAQPWSCSTTCTAPESDHCQDCWHCPGTHDEMCGW